MDEVCVVDDICLTTETLKVSAGKHLAVMIAKELDKFPDNSERMSGTIDVWWIVRILFTFNCVFYIPTV